MNTTRRIFFSLTICFSIMFCSQASFAQKGKSNQITISSLLDELVSIEEGALFPAIPYTTYQVSSYDRASVAPDKPNWFANNDGFGIIREEELEGKKVRVLFDEVGPGAITRIWVTAINKRGVLRFYVDGAKEPTLLLNAYDFAKFGVEDYGKGLLNKHTSYREGDNARGGSTLYFPITYAQSLKITYEAPTDIPLRQKYYHFNVRKYNKGVNIESFKASDLKMLAEKIKQVNQTLFQPLLPENVKVLNKSQALNKGAELSIDLPKGENAIYELKIDVNTANKAEYAQLMRSLVLKASFDDKQTVLVPLGDFSGSGFGAKPIESWFLSADGKGSVTSRWVMPYQKAANIKVINVSGIDATVNVQLKYKERKWTDRSLYFYSAWRYEQGVRLSNDKTRDPAMKPLDWNFATINGRGVYKGDVMSLFNHTRAWYGEGDEKIWIDGENFPSHFGTGLEDYYNSSWAPVVVFQTPFGGAPRADLPSSHGYNTFFRTRNLDGIVFNKSMKFDMETLSWAMGKVDYATTVYFYADANTNIAGTSGENEAAKAILPDAVEHIVENAIEFEKSKPTQTSDGLVLQRQAMNRYDSGLWSDGAHLVAKNAEMNSFAKFKFSGYQNVKQEIKLFLTKSNDFGKLAFWVNGKKVEEEFDSYAVAPTDASISLGEFLPENGAFEVEIRVVGTNTASRGGKFLFGLDCIQIGNGPSPKVAVNTAKVPVAPTAVQQQPSSAKEGLTEMESIKPISVSGNVTYKKQIMERFKTGTWSDNAHLVVLNGQQGDEVVFKFDGFDKSKYNFKLLLTKASDFGILSFAINGKKIENDFDCYDTKVTNAELNLGDFNANKGSFELKVKIVGTNEKSRGAKYFFGLDAIQIQKK